MRYTLTLPTAPSASHPNAASKSYPFELSGSEWLGMAMCATQSYPEQVKTCRPDSDCNILDPAVSPKHVGQAYTELQFYPPAGCRGRPGRWRWGPVRATRPSGPRH